MNNTLTAELQKWIFFLPKMATQCGYPCGRVTKNSHMLNPLTSLSLTLVLLITVFLFLKYYDLLHKLSEIITYYTVVTIC